VAKPELGTKRICPDTGRKFYDMGKSPVISPYTGKVVPIVAPPQSRSRPEAARAAPVAEAESIVPETADAEFVSLEDADSEQQGKTKKKGEVVAEEEEGDDDVTDIIGDGIEKEEEQ
jgi:uncharacterized protein (TIGR02300 family)